ncbi:uncharacterized protein LOC133196795 [Saccostrea echinata]|uniref:uncharacterized protein LOC133196795 n=1 Tax=Saccostrea echinata TaxID=191078 RepID=UPI002A819CD0|nr:uncharacterized protein LOC133196795 [Saccostrea echinata]
MGVPQTSRNDSDIVPRMKTSRELAYVSALNINKSHIGEIVSGRNITESKLLETRLELLEKDKRVLEKEHFWKQRQFFIHNVFDKDRRLKYAGIANKISEVKKDQEKSRTASKLPSISKSAKYDVSLTKHFFPGKIDQRKSVNYKLVLHGQEKLRAAVNAFQAALEIRKRYLEKKKNEGLEKEQNSDLEDERQEGKSTNKDGEVDSTDRSISEIQKSNFIKYVVKNWKSYKKSETHSTQTNKISKETIKQASNSKESQEGKLLGNRTRDRRRHSLVKTEEDKLLLKLAMTLPPNVLTEANDKLSDLSTVLGFSSRNERLRQQAESVLHRPVLTDQRFVNLQKTLIRSSTTHN